MEVDSWSKFKPMLIGHDLCNAEYFKYLDDKYNSPHFHLKNIHNKFKLFFANY